MYEALMEIMEPRLQVSDKKVSIKATVATLRDFGHKDEEIKPAIIKRYNLSSEEADDYLLIE